MPRFPSARRPSATGPLQVDPNAEADALAKIGELLPWALGLRAERELALAHHGQPIEVWAAGPAAGRIQGGIVRAVTAAVTARHRTSFHDATFTTLQALAQHAGIDRSHVLDEVTGPAELLTPIVAAGCTASPLIGPFLGFLLFEHSGTPGRDNDAYGVHKEPGRAPVSRVLGIAGLGPDTLVPVTGRPLVTGTRDDPAAGVDPARLAEVGEHLEAAGLAEVSGVADHVRAQLQLVREARATVRTAVRRKSSATAAARLDPAVVLERGFPRWLIAGQMHVGPLSHKRHPTAGTPYAPGLDRALYEVTAEFGMHPLFEALVGLPGSASQAPELVHLAPDGAITSGTAVADALLALDREAMLTLRGLDDGEKAVVHERAKQAKVSFAQDVRYAIEPGHLRIGGHGGAALPVGAVIRQGLAGARVWLTTADLSDPDVLAEAVVLAELHTQTIERPALNGCLGRYARDYGLHTAQASSLKTRAAVRCVTMLANIVVVGANRLRQTGGSLARVGR